MLESVQSSSRAHATKARKGCRKREECTGVEEQVPSSSEMPLKYGYVSILGRKRVMEEQVTVMQPQSLPGGYSFFAAYGGGGGIAKVAEACADKLHHCLEKLPEVEGLDLGKVVKHCFSCMFEDEAAAMVKFAAVVVAGQKGEVVVANCGGSRAVLWSGGVALPLGRDHKSEQVEEGFQVEGGTITSTNEGDEDESVNGKKRWEPVMTSIMRRNDNSEEFVIIASEGVWKVVGKEMGCEVVRKCLGSKVKALPSEGDRASQASAILAELAIAKGSEDNITIIVVHLDSN